jgi:uroporphyrinogen III methyltransferase/synthase
VVVCDRLALGALPAELPDRIAIHGVGKEAGHHPVPQEEITALLVRLGRSGLRVVRLKGGDPYVFGRGGEEGEELARAGVPFEVVPGVTSGIAAPAYAGIPVTHRREAVRVSLVTAHEAAKRAGPQIRWDLLAADPNGTIVGYMGVSALPKAVSELLGYGMAPTTPAAVVHRGTTSAQRVVRATLATLEAAVLEAGIGPPALFIIGPTALHAAELDWRARLPLRAERIVLSSPAGPLGDALDLAGAELVPVPLPLTSAARFVAAALPITACVLRSRNEVDALDDERDGPTWGPAVLALCLGAPAAERARELGWPNVLELDAKADGAELVARLAAARAAEERAR